MNFKAGFDNWKKTNIVNKVGTGLWALASILLFIGLCCSFSTGQGGFAFLDFVLFAIYVAITIFLFVDSDVAKVIAKNVGYYYIIFIVIMVVEFFVVMSILEDTLGKTISILGDIIDKIGPKALFAVFGANFSVFMPFLAFLLAIAIAILACFLLVSSDRPKNKTCSLVMLLIFGLMGGHLSYVKRTKGVIVRIILTITIILLPISFILCVVDFVKILTNNFKDAQGNKITSWS